MKTYILAPNFTFQPDGSIKIGNVIADPFRPTKTLATLASGPGSNKTTTTTELQTSIRQVKTRSSHGSIWAQFLQTANVHVGAGTSTDLITNYDFDSLETVQLKFDPTEEQVKPLLQNGKVQAAMSAGMIGRQPVYVITGLKIARGFSTKAQTITKVDGSTGIALPVIDQISLGFDVGRGRGNEFEHSFRSTNDIIFAYQLHKIAMKGVRTKTPSVDIYTSKSAFLHEKSDVDVVEVNLGPATVDNMQETMIGDESASIATSDATDGDEPCMCVVYHEK